jgi:hypothetical protein
MPALGRSAVASVPSAPPLFSMGNLMYGYQPDFFPGCETEIKPGSIMNTRLSFNQRATLLLLSLATLGLQFPTLFAQGTAFTYQGSLNDAGRPANGTNYGMIFLLYDTPTNGLWIAKAQIASVSISNGLFTVPLDFGADFSGADRWLEIVVRKNTGPFIILNPRQHLTPAPYAITAGNLSGPLPAGQLTGAIPASSLAGAYGSAVSLNNPSNNLSGVFTGDGYGLTNLNATQIVGGTLPLARLDPAVVTSNYGSAVSLKNTNNGYYAASLFLSPGATIAAPVQWFNGVLSSPMDPNSGLWVNPGHGGAGNGTEWQWTFNQLAIATIPGGHTQLGISGHHNIPEAFVLQWQGDSLTTYNTSALLGFHNKIIPGDAFFHIWSDTYNLTNGGIALHITGTDGTGNQGWAQVKGPDKMIIDQDSGVEIPGYLRLGFAAPAVSGTNYVLNWTNQQCIELDITQALNITETNLNLWGHLTNSVMLTRDIYIYPGLSPRALSFPASWNWENDSGTAVAPTNVAGSTCAHIHLVCTLGTATNRIAHLFLSHYTPR